MKNVGFGYFFGGLALIITACAGAQGSFLIPNGAVTNSKIANSAVTTAKIASGAVTSAVIANGAVGQAQQAPIGQQISASSGSASVSATSSWGAFTNMSVTITTTGKPVFVGLISDGNTTTSIACSIATSSGGYYGIFRGGTVIAQHQLSGGSGNTPCGMIWSIDPVAAGTYTYTLQFWSGTSTGILNNAKLIAYEL